MFIGFHKMIKFNHQGKICNPSEEIVTKFLIDHSSSN